MFVCFRVRARVGWGIWCYPLFRMRFVPGDFVGGGGDGAQTNRIGAGIAQLDRKEHVSKDKQDGYHIEHGRDLSPPPGQELQNRVRYETGSDAV